MTSAGVAGLVNTDACRTYAETARRALEARVKKERGEPEPVLLTRRGFDEPIDADQHLPIGVGPKRIVGPGMGSEANLTLHRTSDRFRVRPLSA